MQDHLYPPHLLLEQLGAADHQRNGTTLLHFWGTVYEARNHVVHRLVKEYDCTATFRKEAGHVSDVPPSSPGYMISKVAAYRTIQVHTSWQMLKYSMVVREFKCCCMS